MRLAENVATEFFATFVLVSVAVRNNSTPSAIALTLGALIYLSERTSGGHMNPAVTVAKYVNNEVDARTALFYIAAQVCGAVTAARQNASAQHLHLTAT